MDKKRLISTIKNNITSNKKDLLNEINSLNITLRKSDKLKKYVIIGGHNNESMLAINYYWQATKDFPEDFSSAIFADNETIAKSIISKLQNTYEMPMKTLRFDKFLNDRIEFLSSKL
jgi:hypothetical protein